jgi:hypothetical protein
MNIHKKYYPIYKFLPWNKKMKMKKFPSFDVLHMEKSRRKANKYSAMKRDSDDKDVFILEIPNTNIFMIELLSKLLVTSIIKTEIEEYFFIKNQAC